MLRQLDRYSKSLWDKRLRLGLGRKHHPLPASTTDSHSPSSQPLWESWNLDPTFFMALSRWTLDHPESSIDRVLKNICDGIDNGMELLQFIPDSPFPARGLIGALAHLVKLGATISTAARDIQVFAKEIIHWVGRMKSAFEHDYGSHFTSTTLRNFSEIRDLIDEICKWATARLEDGRWSRIGYALTIAKEISEFKSRISSARAIFGDLAVITFSQAQDSIMQSVRNLIVIVRQTQAEQLSSILDVLEAQNVALETQNQAAIRRRFLFQILSSQAVGNTAYNEQGKRPCDALP